MPPRIWNVTKRWDTNMALVLITETNLESVRALVEAKDTTTAPSYFIEGIFMQGKTKNQNGRIYPTEILAREMNRYQTEYIDRKRALGELGHPESPTINLDRVSHRITHMQQDGDNFVGRAKIMDTPMGRIVKAFIDDGTQLGVSSRGLGSLSEVGGDMMVGEDFYFSTADIVADPSAPEAFVRGIAEGRAWVWESGVLKECVLEQMAKTIDAAHAPTVSSDVRTETFIKVYSKFLTALRQGTSSNIR